MKSWSFASIITTLALSTNVNAASISFSSNDISVALGDTFTVSILADFTDDATLGGGLDVFFDDSVLSFQSWSFDTTTFILDPSFNRSPDLLSSELEGIAFGNFGGINTSGVLGTLTFEAINSGNSLLSMAVTSDPLKGGDFYSAISFGPQIVNFDTANVSVSAVPLPAAVWLFGAGLLGLAGIARKRS